MTPNEFQYILVRPRKTGLDMGKKGDTTEATAANSNYSKDHAFMVIGSLLEVFSLEELTVKMERNEFDKAKSAFQKELNKATLLLSRDDKACTEAFERRYKYEEAQEDVGGYSLFAHRHDKEGIQPNIEVIDKHIKDCKSIRHDAYDYKTNKLDVFAWHLKDKNIPRHSDKHIGSRTSSESCDWKKGDIQKILARYLAIYVQELNKGQD